MTDYYVATTGSDGAAGTLAAPWLTLNYAVDQLAAGDTLHIRAGTYSEAVNLEDAATGTVGSPVTVKQYQNEAVTIDGSSSRTIYTAFALDYWIFDGLIIDSDHNSVFKTDDFNASYGGNNFWTVQNCTIKGPVVWYGHSWKFINNEVDGSAHPNPLTGLELSNGDGGDTDNLSYNNLIDGNIIHDFEDRGIWLRGQPHDEIVTNNTVYAITGSSSSEGQGINADGFNQVQHGHTISGNTIYDCEVVGIQFENCDTCTIERNTIYDCADGTDDASIKLTAYSTGLVRRGFGATDMLGFDASITIRNNLIYEGGGMGVSVFKTDGVDILGNTIADHVKSGVVFWDDGNNYTDKCTFSGNIISKNASADADGAEVEFEDVVGGLAADDHNVIDPRNTAYRLGGGAFTAYTLAEYQATFNLGLSSFEGAAVFVDAANDNYHIQLSSPAVDIVPLGTINAAVDLDNSPRNVGGSDDAGCYEVPQSIGASSPKKVYEITLQLSGRLEITSVNSDNN